MSSAYRVLTADELANYRAALPHAYGQNVAVIGDLLATLDALTAERDAARQQVAALEAQSEKRLRGADNLRRALELENIRAEASERMLDDFILTLADVLGFDPNAWDTEGGEELAIDAITRGVKDLQPERRITLLVTAALNFEEYAEHLHDCPIALNMEAPCNCGLEELHQTATEYRAAVTGQPAEGAEGEGR